MSGYRLAENHPGDADEVPTLAGVDSLSERLDRAMRDLGDREQQILMLEQELAALKSIGPLVNETGSQLQTATPAVASQPATSPHAGNLVSQDTPDLTPEQAGGCIQWHSITIAGNASDRVSIAPRSQRKAERCAAELHVEFDSDTQFYTGITQDISEGGVFVATYCIQPIGTTLRLAFELPCGTRIETRGIVRWIREQSNTSRPGMGVAFDELSADSLAAIARFCRHNAPLYVEV